MAARRVRILLLIELKAGQIYCFGKSTNYFQGNKSEETFAMKKLVEDYHGGTQEKGEGHREGKVIVEMKGFDERIEAGSRR